MSVTGLPNVIQVFDDIEKGKLRNIDYLECHACWGGCVSGNLTVDNAYVTLSKIYRMVSKLLDTAPEVEAEATRRYPNEDFLVKGELKPRSLEKVTGGLRQRVKRIQVEEALTKVLPGLDCGLCGAPSCETFAKDVAGGLARREECIFLSNKRLRQLRKTYLRNRKGPPQAGY
jgi:hypothetical protein